MCGEDAVGTSEWRYNLRHPSIWYFVVQEGDLGWRPRFGVICVEGVIKTMGIK